MMMIIIIHRWDKEKEKRRQPSKAFRKITEKKPRVTSVLLFCSNCQIKNCNRLNLPVELKCFLDSIWVWTCLASSWSDIPLCVDVKNKRFRCISGAERRRSARYWNCCCSSISSSEHGLRFLETIDEKRCKNDSIYKTTLAWIRFVVNKFWSDKTHSYVLTRHANESLYVN